MPTHKILYHVRDNTLFIKFHGNIEGWPYFIPFFNAVRFELDAHNARSSNGWNKRDGAHYIHLDDSSLLHPVPPEKALEAVQQACLRISNAGADIVGECGGVLTSPSQYQTEYALGYAAGYAAGIAEEKARILKGIEEMLD